MGEQILIFFFFGELYENDGNTPHAKHHNIYHLWHTVKGIMT